jgi:hypothetical protein
LQIVGEQWSVAVFPQTFSVITVNVGLQSSAPGCMDVTTMTKDERREIDLTDEETGQNDVPRAAVVDPKRGVIRA